MFLAPTEISLGESKTNQFEHIMAVWNHFTQETAEKYGVDMRLLNDPYWKEQRKYFLQVSDLYSCFLFLFSCNDICARTL